MNDFGYHAGDLGKSEYRKDFRSGRGTGHFGTGTYFVSDPKLFTRGYKERPIRKIDFGKYKNLYRPKDDEDSYRLHESLSELNNFPNRFFGEGDGNEAQIERANKAREYLLRTFGNKWYKPLWSTYRDDYDDEADSLSTQLMRSLGYNGIDVRGYPLTDNIGKGSVIYDLDEEDSALRDKLRAFKLFGRKSQ